MHADQRHCSCNTQWAVRRDAAWEDEDECGREIGRASEIPRSSL